MSGDGGYTWPWHIGTFPNTGSVWAPIYNPDTTIPQARIKVKGAGNVFFNVNKENFKVTHGDGAGSAIALYPSPAHTTVRLSSGNKGALQFVIYNATGREVTKGNVNGLFDIPVSLWPRGNYIARFLDTGNHRTDIKFVVE
jgi:hypothetical protein